MGASTVAKIAPTQISISELKINPGKYVDLAQKQDIMISRNGKIVAKLVTAKPDKVAIMNELFAMFPKGADVDLEDIRKERLG